MSISTIPVFLRVSSLGNHDFITEHPLMADFGGPANGYYRPVRDVDAASLRTVKITRAAIHMNFQTCHLISLRSKWEYSRISATGAASPGMTRCWAVLAPDRDAG